MRTFTIEDITGFGPWLEGTMAQGARAGMVSAGARIVQDIVTHVIPAEPRMPVDRGIYRAGWQFEVTDDGADVYNATPQAPIIEYGVRAANVKPGKAMIDALTEWVKRKGLGTAKAAHTSASVGPGVSKAKMSPPIDQASAQVKSLVKNLTSKLKRSPGAGGGAAGAGKLGPDDAQARSIAWAIARSMQKKGIFNDGKGLRILEKAMKNMPDIIQQEIAREIGRAFK